MNLMRKYLFILLSVLCLGSCTEDTSIDPTVMPLATTTGANTFGCLVDGWVYVGGRYNYWEDYNEWTPKSFRYYENENKLTGNVSVRPDINLTFTILSPQEGKECKVTDIHFGNDDDELEEGIAVISRFDKKARIISGTFGNDGRLTNGRFDVHYSKATDNSENY